MAKSLFLKGLSFLICLIFLFSCSQGSHSREKTDLEKWMQDDGRLRVLATTAIVEDLVEQIGKDCVKVIAVIKGDLDPHSYEIVKGDGEKFSYADIVFANGLSLEHSASMQYQLAHHKAVVSLGDEVQKKCPDDIIYVDGQVDPHIWMDLSLWSHCVDPIQQKLSQYDPIHKDLYEKRAQEVKKQLKKMDEQIQKKLSQIPLKNRYLVTSHDAFNYHVRRYLATKEEISSNTWTIRMKALQGLAPDEQISLLQINDIVDHVCKYDIQFIFPENNLSQDSLEKVREACQSRGKTIQLAKETLYGDTLGGKSYLKMLEYNTEVLEKHLNHLYER